MFAPVFNYNAGLLKVDGRLVIGSGSSTASSFAAVATSGFTNASSGQITGTGTIALDNGQGTLHNFGTIAPAGVGTVGQLTIDGGLVMESGSTLAIDIAEDRSHDVLRVTGHTVTGGKIAVRYVNEANFREGDPFDVLQSATLDATNQPTLNVSELTVQTRPDGVVLVANTTMPPPPPPAPTPAPPPAPTPAPTPSQAPGQAPAVQEVNNRGPVRPALHRGSAGAAGGRKPRQPFRQGRHRHHRHAVQALN
ncbi:autotransporter outer membrane beta-barrel domain-containing protein [Ramlibacter terrae]|uniref:Autotransporter outer membrane beta-barrel domain-containing protein n=1 Tax=Ramlibacter terrae TaxID=2732511 RepID=A0ABX6P9I5_9BURK|nr:autotransporter outer membrane beta-barrel domain-containing protein [Ramlibacter terrae]